MSGPRHLPRPFWRRRLLPPFLILSTLNLAVFAAFTFPRLLREHNVATRVNVLREEVKQSRERAETVRQVRETIRVNGEEAERFVASVVGTRRTRMVPTIDEIAKLARDQGLTTGRASYGPKDVKGAPLESFAITMPISGSYSQLVGFLDRLERSKQFLTVDEVSLNAPQGENRTSGELRVVVSAYFRTEPRGDDGR